MKRNAWVLITVFCLEVALISLGAHQAEAGPIKLTYSNFFPPFHVQSQLAESWCNEVEKRTSGRVVVEYFPKGTLTKANQNYDGVVTGLSDIGMSCFAYTRGRFPVIEALDLPLGYPSGKAATAVANEFVRKFNPKEIQDTQVMYVHAHGPGIIHTVKNHPVKTLEDLKGLKLRGTGTSALFLQALGGTPVGRPMPECYQMLQKGVVDGASYPFEANKGWRLGEVTKYATAAFSAAYTTTFFVVMNKDKWQSLPADVRDIIGKINAEWAVKHGEAWDTSDMVGIQFFLNQGGTIFGLDSREAAGWAKAVAPVAEKYVAGMKKKGFNNPDQYVDFVKKALKEY